VAHNNLGPLPPLPDGSFWPILGESEREAADKITAATPPITIARDLRDVANEALAAVEAAKPAENTFTLAFRPR
jgi:hypothetical protein